MMKIGELAKQTDVSVGTLRYYESLGLIQPAERSESGYRYYIDAAVQKIQFIKKAQALQFSLTEIKQILVIREQGNPACATVRGLLNEKIDHVDRQIQQLHEFKSELKEYRDEWAKRPLDQPDQPQICSLIEAMTVPLASAPPTPSAVGGQDFRGASIKLY
jgi:DNA-binding transcriptional MerR regulator